MNTKINTRKPLFDLFKEKNHLLKGVSGLEVYEAFICFFGSVPDKDARTGRCAYNTSDLAMILLQTVCAELELKELEQWKKLLPLAPTLTRRDAIKRLIAIGSPGWLQRCSYKRSQLLLCEQDAVQLCYVRKTPGYKEIPIRWSVPVVLGPESVHAMP